MYRFLVVFLLFIIAMPSVFQFASLNNEKSESNCRDPGADELERQLDAYRGEFYLKSDYRLLYSVKNSPSADVNGNDDECDEKIRFKSIIKKKGLCPWKIVQRERNDRYPFAIKTAQCTCSYCSSALIKRSDMGCLPYKQVVPVLVRTNLTSPTGHCEWRQSAEEININCLCTFRDNSPIRLQ
jgi:hypothetical protein